MVLPHEGFQAPGVAIIKYPENEIIPKVAHALEMANASTEAKIPGNYEILMSYVHN